jgi:ribose-phosphate pyrophosphokinase
MGFIRVNGRTVDSFTFPGGELQINIGNLFDEHVIVDACIQNSDDIMKLILVTEAVSQTGYTKERYLNLHYVPYARQDRRCNEGEAHSLRAFAELINILDYDCVHVSDPHSDVVEALIDNVHVIHQEDLVTQIVPKGDYFVVSPDGGALKKIYKVAKALDAAAIVKADKVRDITTGAITATNISIPSLYAQTGKTFLVVDDICDGGRTFVELGKEMLCNGVERDQLELYVTHGIFSKGFDELLQYYSKIYTTNSFRQDINQEGVEVLDVWEIK